LVLWSVLQAIPLPQNSFEVLISSNVIGMCDLEEALNEVERVVKPEGYAIHLLLRPDVRPEKEILVAIHQTLISSNWDYQFEEVDLSEFKETGVMSSDAFKISTGNN